MKMKRYNLVIPNDLFTELQIQAEKDGKQVVDLIRQYIKLGLFVTHSTENGAMAIIRTGDFEQELVIW